MAENINFIPATDLPVAEGDKVSVLCLEDGEMKQKPASGLGGSGGYILKPTIEEMVSGDTGINIMTDGSDMVKAMEAGANVMVIFPAGMMGEGFPPIACNVSMFTTMEGVLIGHIILDVPVNLVFLNAPIPIFFQE